MPEFVGIGSFNYGQGLEGGSNRDSGLAFYLAYESSHYLAGVYPASNARPRVTGFEESLPLSWTRLLGGRGWMLEAVEPRGGLGILKQRHATVPAINRLQRRTRGR